MNTFVIWGAGMRGKMMLSILKEEACIAAFIDSDDSIIGTKVMEKDVISFQSYLKKYSRYPIIVTPLFSESIITFLKKEHVFFFDMEECPFVFRGQGWLTFKKYMTNHPFELKFNVTIYGCTLYSIWVYEQLLKTKKYQLQMVPQDGVEDQFYTWLVKSFPSINFQKKVINNVKTDVLCTVGNEYRKGLKDIDNIVDVFNLEKKIDVFVNPHINKMRGSCSGNKCFIVATGPSLKIEDLNILEKYHVPCIGLNGGYKSFSYTKWRPKYYVIADALGLYSWSQEIRKLDVENIFISDACVLFDYNDLPKNIHVFHVNVSFANIKKGYFTEDFSKIVYGNMTVTNQCIQLAAYLGFKEIYLLGVDCTFMNKGYTHFYDEKNIENKERADGAVMSVFLKHCYESSKNYAEAHGIKIYNATRGGKLEIFERVDFDSLFDGELEWNTGC